MLMQGLTCRQSFEYQWQIMFFYFNKFWSTKIILKITQAFQFPPHNIVIYTLLLHKSMCSPNSEQHEEVEAKQRDMSIEG